MLQVLRPSDVATGFRRWVAGLTAAPRARGARALQGRRVVDRTTPLIGIGRGILAVVLGVAILEMGNDLPNLRAAADLRTLH